MFRGDWRSILESSRGPKCASVNRGQDAAVELLDASWISLLFLLVDQLVEAIFAKNTGVAEQSATSRIDAIPYVS